MKGNATSRTHRAEHHAQRLDWLRARPDLLARLPGVHEDVEPAQSEALDEALRGLKLVRLYAPTAAPITVRWGIRLCVSELRGQGVAARDWDRPRP